MRRTVSKFRGSNLALTLAAVPPRVGASRDLSLPVTESRRSNPIIYGDSSSSKHVLQKDRGQVKRQRGVVRGAVVVALRALARGRGRRRKDRCRKVSRGLHRISIILVSRGDEL